MAKEKTEKDEDVKVEETIQETPVVEVVEEKPVVEESKKPAKSKAVVAPVKDVANKVYISSKKDIPNSWKLVRASQKLTDEEKEKLTQAEIPKQYILVEVPEGVVAELDYPDGKTENVSAPDYLVFDADGNLQPKTKDSVDKELVLL